MFHLLEDMIQIFILYVVFILLGAGGLKDAHSIYTKEGDVKNRSAASMLSLISGLGHFYLGRGLRGFFFYIGFILGMAVNIFSKIQLIENDLLPTETTNVLFFFGLILVIFMLIWAMLDLNRLCNEMGVENVNPRFEMNMKRTDVVLSMVLTIVFIIYFSTSLVMILFESMPYRIIHIATALASLFLPTYVLSNYKNRKREGTWQRY
jgi:TM2 domain-containing membrane protein YozV